MIRKTYRGTTPGPRRKKAPSFNRCEEFKGLVAWAKAQGCSHVRDGELEVTISQPLQESVAGFTPAPVTPEEGVEAAVRALERNDFNQQVS